MLGGILRKKVGIRMKAVLFDLDGTLLHMEQEEFVKSYFTELSKVICDETLDAKTLSQLVWAGTKAMVQNDGKQKNEEIFWNVFQEHLGQGYYSLKEKCDEFYTREFHNVRAITKENLLAKKAVELAGKDQRKVVLATNPFFPMAAQKARISWIDLYEENFEFITCYETDCFCKPNPDYYRSICERLGVKPGECLMIGNDEKEDMYAASSIGMECFLVTDYMIEDAEHHWDGERGSFADMIKKLERLS